MTILFCRLYFNIESGVAFWTIDERVFKSSIEKVDDVILPGGIDAEAYEVYPYTETDVLPSGAELTRDIQLQYIGAETLDYDGVLQLAINCLQSHETDLSTVFKVTEEQKIAN